MNRPIARGNREWSYGLFDCFSAGGLCALNRSTRTSSLMLTTCRSFPFPPPVVVPRRLLRLLVPLHGLWQEQATPAPSAKPRSPASPRQRSNGQLLLHLLRAVDLRLWLGVAGTSGMYTDGIWQEFLIRIRRPRFPLAKKSVSAMTFAATDSPIVSRLFAATAVLSRKNAGKSSWRSVVSRSEQGFTVLI